MSKTEENLIDKIITLYLDGGWEVSGLVKSVSDGKIVLEQEGTGKLFLVFREKVSCLQLEGDREASTGGKRVVEKNVIKKNYDDEFPMNDIGYNDSGMSIPRGMLHNLPDDDDNDLSMTFGGDTDKRDPNARGSIDFRIDDDSKKED